jgi:hypothetical protein
MVVMSEKIFLLNPHNRMTAAEALQHCTMDAGNFQDVMIIGIDADGDLIVRSSKITREQAAWILLAALDYVRGK